MLVITPKANGNLYYYGTSDTEKLPHGDFGTAWEANGGKTISNTVPSMALRFSISNVGGRYFVVCLQKTNLSFYNYLIIDTTTGKIFAEPAD